METPKSSSPTFQGLEQLHSSTNAWYARDIPHEWSVLMP
jgi:hypothetical protein